MAGPPVLPVPLPTAAAKGKREVADVGEGAAGKVRSRVPLTLQASRPRRGRSRRSGAAPRGGGRVDAVAAPNRSSVRRRVWLVAGGTISPRLLAATTRTTKGSSSSGSRRLAARQRKRCHGGATTMSSSQKAASAVSPTCRAGSKPSASSLPATSMPATAPRGAAMIRIAVAATDLGEAGAERSFLSGLFWSDLFGAVRSVIRGPDDTEAGARSRSLH